MSQYKGSDSEDSEMWNDGTSVNYKKANDFSNFLAFDGVTSITA